MLAASIKAIVGITVILGGWIWVQNAWRRVFPGTPVGEDVLAGRISCHNCTCNSPCERAVDGSADPDFLPNQTTRKVR